MHRLLTGALAVALITGCSSSSQTPVRLQGDPASMARLAGAWTGQYWGGAGGRGGSLSFALRSGTDSLYGDVTMVDSRGQQIRAADASGVHAMHVRSPQQLRIDFVAIHADSVRGVLEPYVAPDCDCTVNTTFVGQVKANEIKGTFQTRSGGRVQAEGAWEMKRAGT
ncbi:MAG TPA: hypothetical protein VJT85_03135 [Gemmatimonadaceae bacterium]|nr:hypothetical protein [Gemmatimonadaceae bacterium]